MFKRGENHQSHYPKILLFISVIIVSIAKVLLKYEEAYYMAFIHSFIDLVIECL